MAERHIDQRPWEVQAILAGRKSQTRRVLKPQPEHLQVYDWKGIRLHDSEYRHWCWKGHVGADNWDDITTQLRPALPYAVGDRLWCREAWRTESRAYDDLAPSDMDADYPVLYEADAEWKHNKSVGRLRAAMHMPRWASRLTLTVTDVRVQRLQDISEADAIAEGLRNHGGGEYGDCWWPEHDGLAIAGATARDGFRLLWNHLHGPGSWDANPWVAAITFSAERRNIDGGTT